MRWPYLLAIGLILALTAGIGCVFWPFGSGGDTLVLSGVVEIQEVRLGSKQGGRVAEVLVAEGDLVEPGQALVRFEMPEMEAQRLQWQAKLAASEADLDRVKNGPRAEEIAAARAAMNAAEANLKLLKAGSRSEDIRRAKSDLASAEADLKLTLDEYDRAYRLLRQGSLARAEFDTARAARDRARGRVSAMRALVDLLEAGNRPEEIAEAEAKFQQTKAQHQLLEAGSRTEDIAEAQAVVTEIQGKLLEIEAHLAEKVVRAPEKSVVEVLAVRKGDLVAPNQPVVKVLRTDDLWVKVYVPETELGKITAQQPVEVKVDSYPDRSFQGKVTLVANASEFTPRNVQSADERRHQVFGVKVHVDDPQGVFKSGMAAEVTFRFEE